MHTPFTRTFLTTGILMVLLNVVAGIASHHAIPAVNAILAATNHLLYLTVSLTAATLLTRQFALLLSYIAICILCSMGTPGFSILTIFYPVFLGLLMGIVMAAAINDATPAPLPAVPPPPPPAAPPPPPPAEYAPRQRGRRDAY